MPVSKRRTASDPSAAPLRRARLGLLALLGVMALALGPTGGVAESMHPLARLSPIGSWFGQQASILIWAGLVYACAVWMDHLERHAPRRRDRR